MFRRTAPVATLASLGPRVCILGPSGSGKSTLAQAIGQQRGMPVVHLDRFYHQLDSDWVPRPAGEFAALHDAAIGEPVWIMEGNYSLTLPQRLARATGVIVLDVSTARSLWRYVRRACFDAQRHGGLDSGRDSVKWHMIRHIWRSTPVNRRRYRALAATLEIPVVRLPSAHVVVAAYRSWQLSRPQVLVKDERA